MLQYASILRVRRRGIVVAAATAITVACSVGVASATDWPSAGGDAGNTRNGATETTLTTSNVAGLKVKWTLTANGDVMNTPSVVGGVVYTTDRGTSSAPSTLWALNANTGAVLWSDPISSYTGIAGDNSRTTPTYSNGLLILGDRAGTSGAWVFAVDAATGALVWKTQVESHPNAIITGSPNVSGGIAVVPVSSFEEGGGANCCTFRGSVVALDVATGNLLWKTYDMPDNGGVPGGYSGGAIWGSTPAIDPVNRRVFVATGNAYTVPAGVCASPTQKSCTPPSADDHADSILALNLDTGAIVWATPSLSSDATYDMCHKPQVCGPDLDFGSGPNLFTATSTGRQLVGAGQKSGFYFALAANTGKVVWKTKIGPGSSLGGIMWGSAADGNRVYAAEADGLYSPYFLGSRLFIGGSWSALDAATGKILWRRADPQLAPDTGFMTTANGLVFAPSSAGKGTNMYVLDAVTGKTLWSFASGGSVIGGAAIADGTVYWGSGYYIGKNNNKLYAFALPQTQ